MYFVGTLDIPSITTNSNLLRLKSLINVQNETLKKV